MAVWVESTELAPRWELSPLVTLAASWWLRLGEGGSRTSVTAGACDSPPRASVTTRLHSRLSQGRPPDLSVGLCQPVPSTSEGRGSSLNSSCIRGADLRAVRGGPHWAPVGAVAEGCGCPASGSLDDRAGVHRVWLTPGALSLEGVWPQVRGSGGGRCPEEAEPALTDAGGLRA